MGDSGRELDGWRNIFEAKARELYPASDPSHDFLHIRRVAATAVKFAAEEGADLQVVLAAAYFHDFVNVPKHDPRRKEASRLSAVAASEYLFSIGYPAGVLESVRHAIAAHSFSAGIAPETIEAKVVQDADRLDSLGAIGVARCFSTSALMGRPYYHEEDIFADSRAPDDHFFVKLFKLADMLQTEGGRKEGQRRVAFMRDYLSQLRSETGV